MFDSPLFWIFLIWWLLSAIAGNKKRKARVQQSALDEMTAEPDIMLDDDGLEPADEPLTAPQFLETILPPEEPRKPEPPPALADIMRSLGLMPEQPLEPVFVPEVEEPEPELVPEEVEEVVVEESPAVAPQIVDMKLRTTGPLDRLDRLPMLQRAVILKEILDRPKALRRPGVF